MNLLLLYPKERLSDQENIFCVTGSRIKKLFDDHDLQSGLTIMAGVLDGEIGKATITECTHEKLQLTFSPEYAPPKKLQISLAVAYSRPQASKRVMQLAAQAGIADLHFIPTANAQKSYQQSTIFQEEESSYQFELGLQQGCDTVFPVLHLWKKISDFHTWLLQPETPQVRYLANTAAENGKFEIVAPDKKTLFLIGPEQGFTSDEVDEFTKYNCRSLGLGARILKVDVACAVLLGTYHAKVFL